MVRCRRALESAVDKYEKKAGQQLIDLLESSSRVDFVRGLVSKTKEFLAPTAHGSGEPVLLESKTREDARLAVLTSYGIVIYMGHFLLRKTSQVERS